MNKTTENPPSEEYVRLSSIVVPHEKMQKVLDVLIKNGLNGAILTVFSYAHNKNYMEGLIKKLSELLDEWLDFAQTINKYDGKFPENIIYSLGLVIGFKDIKSDISVTKSYKCLHAPPLFFTEENLQRILDIYTPLLEKEKEKCRKIAELTEQINQLKEN